MFKYTKRLAHHSGLESSMYFLANNKASKSQTQFDPPPNNAVRIQHKHPLLYTGLIPTLAGQISHGSLKRLNISNTLKMRGPSGEKFPCSQQSTASL